MCFFHRIYLSTIFIEDVTPPSLPLPYNHNVEAALQRLLTERRSVLVEAEAEVTAPVVTDAGWDEDAYAGAAALLPLIAPADSAAPEP